MRSIEKLIIDLLEDIYPEQISMEELASITGYSKTYLSKKILEMKDKRWVEIAKTGEEIYIKFSP
ncbi:MAG TPA: AraC family transcriptional regulator [Euryarchaeota archaeon]|nr:AraC family transcriptional regulator [Euryarchaeota archaeon]